MYNKVTEPVGALSQTLGTCQAAETGLAVQGNIALMETSKTFQVGRQRLKDISSSLLPSTAFAAVAKVDEYARDFVKTVPFKGSGAGARNELFEQLGFSYVGPIDGHDMETLVAVLENSKRNHEENIINKPILIHVKTKKGKGYEPAETASDKLHAVRPKFNLPKADDLSSSKAPETSPKLPLTTVFGESLVKEAERDEKIVAITAAMPGGTGVSIFEERFGPSRTFDVGIAEQHAVTFAGALAASGLKPFVAIYSTFLQRGYDQVIHDVALQNLPVRFVIDRAGLVGGDGPTHEGAFDLSYLACIPNMRICAPADEIELVHMTHTLARLDDGPSAMRYPRGTSSGIKDMPEEPLFLEPGKGRIVREGHDGVIAILSVGSRLDEALEAAQRLESWGISATVADARWVKPLDESLVMRLAAENRVLITVEENAIGGFSAQVAQLLQEHGALDGTDRKPLVFRSMVLPDRFIAADDDVRKQYDDAELNATHIMAKIHTALGAADVRAEAPVMSNAGSTGAI
jgi:1-deoxy-D-xylulose-5-phosphate synthase